MKKQGMWFLALVLFLSVTIACAGEDTSIYDIISELEWRFESGAGGWSTELEIQSDGSFIGRYHDSEMGETGDGYPDGTIYGCSFSGTMTITERVDENTWKIQIDTLSLDEGQVPEAIEEGIRFVTTGPAGISEGDTMLLYSPGTPAAGFTEDMLFWSHLIEQDETAVELRDWFLYSEKNESGFVGYPADDSLSIANPWVEMTAEELRQIGGVPFHVPGGADHVIYRYFAGENLAEVQFTLGNDEFCFRYKPAALQEGELENISGIYFLWENEEAVQIKHCPGFLGQAKTGSTDWVQLCQWYDAAPGLMYSLSVYTTDPDGLDLTAVAEMVFVPAQGDAGL